MGTNEFNGTDVATAIFSFINLTSQKFGINYISSVLVGSKSAKVERYNHTQIKEHGLLKDYSFNQIKEFIRELIERGYLIQTQGEYPIVQLLNKANQAIDSNEQINLKVPDPKLAKISAQKGESINKTLELFKQGKSVKEIALERNLAQTTVLSHLSFAYQNGEEINIDDFVEAKKQRQIAKAFRKLGLDYLTPVKQVLDPEVSWEDLKWVKAKLVRSLHFV